MYEKRFVSRVTGSSFERVKSFGYLLPFAFFWYLFRYLRQGFWLIYFRSIGRYAFRVIGKSVKIDGMQEIIFPCADIRLGNYVRLGKRCVFQGSPDSTIIVGNRVTINDGCYLTSMFSITIGENTSIGEYTSIRDYNHKFDDPTISIKDQDYYGTPIEIGKDCWIGRGCMILPGVVIGDGVVIGANAVVTKDISSYSVVGGIPAKLIKMRKL